MQKPPSSDRHCIATLIAAASIAELRPITFYYAGLSGIYYEVTSRLKCLSVLWWCCMTSCSVNRRSDGRWAIDQAVWGEKKLPGQEITTFTGKGKKLYNETWNPIRDNLMQCRLHLLHYRDLYVLFASAYTLSTYSKLIKRFPQSRFCCNSIHFLDLILRTWMTQEYDHTNITRDALSEPVAAVDIPVWTCSISLLMMSERPPISPTRL